MFTPRLQLIIGTLLGIGFLTIAFFIIAVCFFWIIAWTLPMAWRVWSLWKAFAAYRRGESVMVSAMSAISPKAALWLPRLSAVIFHLLGRPAPPNWRAQAPPSFAQAAHLAQNEAGQREGVPNPSWLRQAERDRMMASRNEAESSNVSYDANSNQSSIPPPPPPHPRGLSAERAEGGWFVEAAISAIQFIQHAAQQLMEKLSDYRPNQAANYQQNFHQRLASQPAASFEGPINAAESHPNITPPPKQPLQDSLPGGVKRRHPYPQDDPDISHYTTPQPSAPSR